MARAGRCPLAGADGNTSWPGAKLTLGLMCGSLFGKIRDWIGVVNLSYLTVDDPRSSTR